MKSATLPKTIAKWAAQNADKVDFLKMERDCFGEKHEGPWSAWLYLNPGFAAEVGGGHIIHEPTVNLFMEATQLIGPCDCVECQNQGGTNR